ncbi:MAG: metallophosphoesterase family protein [Methanomassiliicoccales archaeon]
MSSGTVAVVSDIHGNSVALRSVLEDLDAESPELIICLGDIVGRGPDPLGSLSLIRRSGALCVVGNIDAVVSGKAPDAFDHTRGHQMREIDDWSRKLLSADDRIFINSLPLTRSLPSASLNVFCFHASPSSFMEGIDCSTSQERLEAMLHHHGADIFLCGHTHQRMIRHCSHSTLLNPGSVGLPYRVSGGRQFRPIKAEYALVGTRGRSFSFEFREIGYDFEALRSSVLSSDMPNGEWWLSQWKGE